MNQKIHVRFRIKYWKPTEKFDIYYLTDLGYRQFLQTKLIQLDRLTFSSIIVEDIIMGTPRLKKF